MLSEWHKFKGWVVLEHFLKNPDCRAYVRGLARENCISPLSASRYLKTYANEGFLLPEKCANALYYRLDNGSPAVKALKRFYFLAKVGRIESAPAGTTSIAVFGTHASGEYGSNSDVDLLVISQDKSGIGILHEIEQRSGRDVDATVISLGKWRELAKRGDGFYKSVMNNHILLWGSPL